MPGVGLLHGGQTGGSENEQMGTHGLGLGLAGEGLDGVGIGKSVVLVGESQPVI